MRKEKVAMITTLIALATLSTGNETVCPIMGGAANMAGPKVEFNGAQFAFCCGGCDSTFSKDPVASMKNPKTKGKNIGVFLFDPVSHRRVKEAKITLAYNGIVYPFESAANKAKFEKSAKTYAAWPTKEVMECPVTGEKIESYSKSVAYYDISGIRYYICCAGCIGTMESKGKEMAAKHASAAQAPKAVSSN